MHRREHILQFSCGGSSAAILATFRMFVEHQADTLLQPPAMSYCAGQAEHFANAGLLFHTRRMVYTCITGTTARVFVCVCVYARACVRAAEAACECLRVAVLFVISVAAPGWIILCCK